MSSYKSELSGKGWRIVRYGDYYHIYGIELVKRTKLICTKYTINHINNSNTDYLVCHIDSLPVKLAI